MISTLRPKITPLGILLAVAFVLVGPWLLDALYGMLFTCSSHRVDPMEGRTVVVVDDSEVAVLEAFRKDAVSDVIDPAGVELKRLTRLLKMTKKGKRVPPDWEQRTDEALTHLLELLEQAKDRKEPKRYHKKFSYALWGIWHTYMATLVFQEYCDAPPGNPTVRKAAYKEAWKHIKKARANLKKGRAFFSRDPEAKS